MLLVSEGLSKDFTNTSIVELRRFQFIDGYDEIASEVYQRHGVAYLKNTETESTKYIHVSYVEDMKEEEIVVTAMYEVFGAVIRIVKDEGVRAVIEQHLEGYFIAKKFVRR